MNLLLLRVAKQYLREIAKFFLCSGKQRESQLERAVIYSCDAERAFNSISRSCSSSFWI